MLHLIYSVGYNNLSVKQKIFYINPDLGNFTPPLPPPFYNLWSIWSNWETGFRTRDL